MQKSTFWSVVAVCLVLGVFSGVFLGRRSSLYHTQAHPSSEAQPATEQPLSSQKCLQKCFATMMGCEVSAGSNMFGGGLGCGADFSECQKICNPYGSGTMIS